MTYDRWKTTNPADEFMEDGEDFGRYGLQRRPDRCSCGHMPKGECQECQQLACVEGATSAIVSAVVGSCTCNVKTPEIEHHEGMCRYALLSRALDHLQRYTQLRG